MRSAVILLLVLTGSCATDPALEGVCPQSYEFGNYGCVVVRGRVFGTDGQPMPGASVQPGSGADSDQFGSTPVYSQVDGTFFVRLVRYWPGASADSASVWIKAVAPQASVQRDSVLLRVRMADVGATPDTVSVNLQLKGPPVAHTSQR